MRKGLRNAPLILVGIVLVGLVLYCVWPHERTYQGRPLSQWLEEYRQVLNNTNREQREKDEARFAALPPAMVPDLVKMLGWGAGLNFEEKLGIQLFRFPATRSIANRLALRLFAAQKQRLEVNHLLGAMGAQAEPAIPAMLRIYQRKDTPVWLRNNILQSLVQINRRPDLVVPVLTESLSYQGDFTVRDATHALGEIGTNAISAIPALRETIHHSNMLNALAAVHSIHMIDPKASLAAVDEAMPVLLRALESGSRTEELTAIQLLVEYGDRAKAAVPLLVKIRAVGDFRLSRLATEALKRIDPEAAAKAGVQ